MDIIKMMEILANLENMDTEKDKNLAFILKQEATTHNIELLVDYIKIKLEK